MKDRTTTEVARMGGGTRAGVTGSDGKSTRGRRVLVVLGAVLVVALLSACAAGPNEAASSTNDAGFWFGLWHGLIAPVTFVISLFSDTVGVYEVDNRGGWYDFGFLLGASMVLGGGGAGGSRSRRR